MSGVAATRVSPGLVSRGTPSRTSDNANRSGSALSFPYDRGVASLDPSAQDPLTIDALVDLAARIAAELRAAGFGDAATALAAATRIEGPAHERLLVVREALVRTRPAWSELVGDTPGTAAAALTAAKRLAIEL